MERFVYLINYRFLRLEAGAGDERHDQLVAVDAAGLDEALQAGDDDAAGRLGEDALALGEQLDAVDDLVVVRRPRPSRRSRLSPCRA